MSLSKNRKLVSGLAALAGGGALAVGGVFAAFTDTQALAPQTIAAGTVTMQVADSTGATPPAKFTQDITGMAAGDTVYRALTLKNTGTLDMASATMTAAVAPSNALATTAVGSGLGVTVDSCSVPWTISSPTAAPTCSGTTTSVKAATNLAGLSTATSIPGGVLTAAGQTNLMFKYVINASAGDALEGLSTAVTYTFNGTQRAATTATQ